MDAKITEIIVGASVTDHRPFHQHFSLPSFLFCWRYFFFWAANPPSIFLLALLIGVYIGTLLPQYF